MYFHINHNFYQQAYSSSHIGRPLAEGNRHWREWIRHRRTIWGGGSKNEDQHWAICQAFGQRSVFSINQFKHIQVNRLRRESIIFFLDQKCIKQALVLTSSFWMSAIYIQIQMTTKWEKSSQTNPSRYPTVRGFVALDPETSDHPAYEVSNQLRLFLPWMDVTRASS